VLHQREQEKIIDRVGVHFNISNVNHHLLEIATRALYSNNAKRHLNTVATWLTTTIYTATMKLQQHVEHNIRSREIENEIEIETISQSIQTASKAVANDLIRTSEDGPTDLHGIRIAAIVSAQVQAALKKRQQKKRRADNTKATTNLPYTSQRPNKRRKRETQNYKTQIGPAQLDTRQKSLKIHNPNYQQSNGKRTITNCGQTHNTHRQRRNNITTIQKQRDTYNS
jgi:hypothetical protein